MVLINYPLLKKDLENKPVKNLLNKGEANPLYQSLEEEKNNFNCILVSSILNREIGITEFCILLLELGCGSHSLSAEGTNAEVKMLKGPPTRSRGAEGPKTSSFSILVVRSDIEIKFVSPRHIYTLLRLTS